MNGNRKQWVVQLMLGVLLAVLPVMGGTGLVAAAGSEAQSRYRATVESSVESDVAPEATPALELAYVDDFFYVWTDAGSSADNNGSFAVPVAPAGFVPLTHFGEGSIFAPPKYTLVARALEAGALATPVDFTLIWTDSGSGADQDGSFWRPIPPTGYVCLGDVVQGGYAKPLLDTIYCVRQDLTSPGKLGEVIWHDGGSGADNDFVAWHILPKEENTPDAGINLNGFTASSNGAVTTALYTIKSSVVAKPNPAPGVIESLIAAHGPIIVIHPDEKYLPDDPTAVLNNNARLCHGLVHNENSYDTMAYDQVRCYPTSAATLLTDVAQAESSSLSDQSDFRIYLKADDSTKPGDLSRAKAYVRVLPREGIFVEVQFWIYYPFNGPGKSRIQIGDIQTDHVFFTTVGRHYGDWESVRLRFVPEGSGTSFRWVQTILSRHGDEFVISSFGRLDSTGTVLGGQPIVYAARDSHAHYPTPGTQYYERAAHVDIGVGHVDVDLKDLTDGNYTGTRALDLSKVNRYQIVSSEYAAVSTDPPDWLFFKYRWGQHERLAASVTYSDPVLGDLYSEDYNEIGNGPTGPSQKSIWPYINDATEPVVESTIIGTKGENNWYVSDVNVNWTVSDPDSPVSQVGCDPVFLSADTKDSRFTCTATSAGGRVSKVADVLIDKTEPSIVASVSPPPNANGWNNTSVTASFECTDTTSGIAYCSPNATYPPPFIPLAAQADAQEFGGTFTMAGNARDYAGNRAYTVTPLIRMDLNAPSATVISPQAGKLYGTNTELSFNWTATDDVSELEASGIDTEVAFVDSTPVINGQTLAASTLAPGNHTFTLDVTDMAGNVRSESVDFTIVDGPGDNIAPVFTGTPLTYLNISNLYEYSVTTHDANPGDSLTITAPSKPLWLTLTDNGNGTATLKGTPENQDVGEHNIILQVTDDAGGSSIQSFTIQVTGFVLFENNLAPTPTDDTATVDFDSEQNSIDVLANDSDPNEDLLTIVAVSQPAKGSTAFTGTTLQYWPEPGVSGTDTFTYTVSDDGDGNLTANATVTVTILDGPDNQAPVAVDDTADVDFASTDNSIEVLANDSDPDSDTLTLTAVGTAAHGVAYAFDNVAVYTPDPDYSGEDSFTYTIEDDRGGVQTGTVIVTVGADPNAGPDKSDTAVTLTTTPNPSAEGQAVELKATVTSADGTPSGSVTFREGTTELGTAPLDAGGMATLSLSMLTVGDHQLSAWYEGSSKFTTGTAPIALHAVTAINTTGVEVYLPMMTRD